MYEFGHGVHIIVAGKALGVVELLVEECEPPRCAKHEQGCTEGGAKRAAIFRQRTADRILGEKG